MDRNATHEKTHPGERETSEEIASSTLNSRAATVVLIAYLASQFFCGLVSAIMASIIGANYGIYNLHQIYMVSNALEPGWICATFLLGGLTVILVSRKSIPMSLRDISPTGAAWVLGTVKSLVLALIVGLILGTLAQFLNVLRLTSALHGVGPVARMYLTPGLPQVAVFVAGVFLCPTVEEILFRGVVYGGYRRSFGAGAAAMLTTALFTIWHIPEYIHFWPGLVVVVAEGLAALSFRLHWGAIGPAIAVHTGCNLATVAFVFIASFLR